MFKLHYPTICLAAALLGCGGSEDQSSVAINTKPEDQIAKLNVEGVKNVYRLSPRIITGGKPDSEAGFAELQKLGVTTIVSVTDDDPDEETAKKYGLKYVHVPMDYEGVSVGQQEMILGAFSDASEPVYIHCNSGRNRGATAAAMCLIGVEGESNEKAISWMKTRGVDEKNQKLYQAVKDYRPVAKQE